MFLRDLIYGCSRYWIRVDSIIWKNIAYFKVSCIYIKQEAALQEATTNLSKVSLVIDSLKKTIDDDRVLSIKVPSYVNYNVITHIAIL